MIKLRKFGSAVAHVAKSGRGEAHTAHQVGFDNTDTGLEAETVQEAIVEAAQAGGGGDAPDVHEDVLVLDGDSLASADVVFDKVRRTVVIDIDITDIFGPPKFAFETPVVVETDASFTITPDLMGAITLTVASGTYTHLEDLVRPLNDTQAYVHFSVADGDAEGKRVLVAVADESVTFEEGTGGLALLNLSALDEQTVPGFSEEFGTDFAGEPDPAEPSAGRVSVAWISGANTEFGPDGPAVKVIPYSSGFNVQAPPTALIDAITAPGSYQMVATGGPAGTVVVSAMDNVVHGTITITGH